MKNAFLATILCIAVLPVSAQWQPVEGRIMTPWAEKVTPDNAWPEYPRPQMVRERWLNLNGLWDYAIVGPATEYPEGRIENAKFDPLHDPDLQAPERWDGRILVPYCVESALSGAAKIVRPEQVLWYRRGFAVPDGWGDDRVRLNFQAVDWHAVVFVNGKRVGENKGGYVPFSLDITDALLDSGQQEVVVAVWDPTNIGDQAVGKQSLPERRTGFRYTPTTGIWQTVWMEPLPVRSIAALDVVPDVDAGSVRVRLSVDGEAGDVSARVRVLEGDREVARGSGRPGGEIVVSIPEARLWSPDDPFLYNLAVSLHDGGEAMDSVDSYFGMRKIEIRRDEDGVARYYLNNKLLRFQYGPLDQGYWPDATLLPTTDDAAEFDVRYLRDIGCNMVRVHVKVHPDRWYYHADRHGLLVWQDMVCTRKFDSKITPESARQWEREQRRMVDLLRNHPSVIQWVVFNEGWGQYDTVRLTKWTQRYDPTRPVIAASGWTDYKGTGDVRDIHDYSYHPSIPLPEAEGDRAIVIGEFGGFNVYVKGHLWHPDQWEEPRSDALREAGRERYGDGKAWLESYRHWINSWKYLIGDHGLNAGVYTQISDVEHEPNGWLTYDRKLEKIPRETLRTLHEPLYEEPARPAAVLLPNGLDDVADWRYTTDDAPQGWEQPGFDDSAWTVGKGPFGGPSVKVPRSSAGVTGKQVFLRRRVQLERVPDEVAVRGYFRGDVEVYINGKLARAMNNRGPRNEDVGVTIQALAPEARALLRSGGNLIAVSAKVARGPSFVDVGLVALE